MQSISMFHGILAIALTDCIHCEDQILRLYASQTNISLLHIKYIDGHLCRKRYNNTATTLADGFIMFRQEAEIH